MPVPEWTRYIRVDTVIECYDIPNTTQAELLSLMPNAYGGEPPGEDDWPEPDAKRDAPYKLSNIWDKLSSGGKADILAARKET